MAKTTNNVKEQNQEQNAVLEAIQNTPAKVGRIRSDLNVNIKKIFEMAKCPLALNQIAAAYKALTGEELPNKKFADRCWTLSTKNTKNKAPLLKGSDVPGVYELI